LLYPRRDQRKGDGKPSPYSGKVIDGLGLSAARYNSSVLGVPP